MKEFNLNEYSKEKGLPSLPFCIPKPLNDFVHLARGDVVAVGGENCSAGVETLNGVICTIGFNTVAH